MREGEGRWLIALSCSPRDVLREKNAWRKRWRGELKLLAVTLARKERSKLVRFPATAATAINTE